MTGNHVHLSDQGDEDAGEGLLSRSQRTTLSRELAG